MRCTCVTGKLWKHEVWNAVICRKGGDPSMLRFSSTRSITPRSGWVMGWDLTLSMSAPPDGSTADTCCRHSHRVWLARKYSRDLIRSLSVGGNWCL
jgi:hypothetical protein